MTVLLHYLCVVVRDGSCGDVEVPEDLVATPSANDFDDIDVDATEEEVHGAAGKEAASGDFCVDEADGVPNGDDGDV